MRQTTPIADYGLIGNTRTAALVSRNGSIDWCCFPRFDSPSVFGSILDSKRGGFFKIAPLSSYTSSQSYVPDTNVLETRFKSGSAEFHLLDCFTVDFEQNKKGKLLPHHELLRVLECINGEAEIKVEFCPRPLYGKGKFRIKDAGKLGLRVNLGSEVLFLNCTPSRNWSILSNGKEANLIFHLKAGERAIFSLTYSLEAPAVLAPLTGSMHRLNATLDFWRAWTRQCTYHGPYEEHVKRSALALKLLFFSPSGAMIAAPTTSLPEWPGGERNWDYRYCWLRDASLTIRSFIQLGFFDEAKAYLSWILHTTAITRPLIKVLYDSYGESRLPEKEISWFKGHRKSRPVRIGNGADQQFQLDIYGEVMNALYLFTPYLKYFDRDMIDFMEDMGNAVCRLWDKPDDGIWEVRSGSRQHVHSKAMAWLALDRLIKITEEHHLNIDLADYRKARGEIMEFIESKGYDHGLQSYIQDIETRGLDASLLTLPILGFEPKDPERLKGTVLAIKRSLTHNSMVYRYKDTPDGLSGTEGAFGACCFWMVEALKKIGMKDESRLMMEELIERSNDLKLWSEEINPETNEFLGNYPQAFTHTALISAALALKER